MERPEGRRIAAWFNNRADSIQKDCHLSYEEILCRHCRPRGKEAMTRRGI